MLGGTCLHKGCIPTKALLKSAEILRTVKDSVHFGVNVGQYSFDLKSMMKRKDKIVKQMHQGIEGLMQKNHIDIFNGTGRIMGTSIFSPQSGTISVEYDNGESELLPNQNVLIATGSLPTQLPFLPFNHTTVLSSNDILQLTDLPVSIAIIGGGVIGLEFASLLIDLGVNVSVIEAGERILPNESAQIAHFLKTSLIARGVTFYENCTLNESVVTVNSNSVTIQVNKDKTIEVEKF